VPFTTLDLTKAYIDELRRRTDRERLARQAKAWKRREWAHPAGPVEPGELLLTLAEDTLRFELSPENCGTHLVLIDELPPGTAAGNAAGWDECLDRLAGLEPASDGGERRFQTYSAAFEPTLGPQEGPRLDRAARRARREGIRSDETTGCTPGSSLDASIKV
jgi:hypothetical protein